jgi:hypothetical protein
MVKPEVPLGDAVGPVGEESCLYERDDAGCF